MRIGARRLPRRRDPRRRFRNRLLLGMVGVALLPLVAFAVLAVFELDTVAKSTANATETAILQRQQSQQQSSVNRAAFAIDRALGAVDFQLTTLATALNKELATTPPTAPLPKGLTNAGDVSYLNAGGTDTLIVGTGATAEPDGTFAAATSSSTILTEVAGTLKADSSIAAIWFQNQVTGAVRAFPEFPVSSALSAQRYDVTHPTLRNGVDVFATSEGGVSTIAPGAWIDPGEPGRNASGPFWTDTYALLETGEPGVSVWYSIDGKNVVGFDLSSDSVANLIAPALSGGTPADASSLVVSASGKLVYGTSQALTDFPNSASGSTLNAPPGQNALAGALRRMESTGTVPAAPVTAKLSKVNDDVFPALVYNAHWVVVSPVAINTLEPNLNSLTLGITDGIHRLFPVTVLPVLVLLVVLAFIATTLLSRRMYLPVQALTDHAVLEERTRLAREIHDTLAQQLTGIVLELEAADTLLNRGSEGRARSSVEKARELARGALQEARRSVWNLRPAPLSATGLVAAIGHEVEAWEERTGIPARFKARALPQHPSLSPTAEVALLRIGQEALSNAARHGHPEHVDVELRAHRQELVLSVSDDGVGFDPAASAPREDCFGLDGMAERARNAGGTLTVVSSPGRGTTVTTRLPLTETVVIAETG